MTFDHQDSRITVKRRAPVGDGISMATISESYEQDTSSAYGMIIGCLKRAELREIERHKYYMSLERGEDVGFETAANDWLANYAQAWREERQQRMLALQREEINRYKWIQSERASRDLGGEAVLEWIQKYAAHWREWYENEYYDDIECPDCE